MPLRPLLTVHFELSEIVLLINRVRIRNISIYASSFLGKIINQRLEQTSCRNFDDYSQYLTNSPEEAELLWSSLIVSLSQFFGTPFSFACCYVSKPIDASILEKSIREWLYGG